MFVERVASGGREDRRKQANEDYSFQTLQHSFPATDAMVLSCGWTLMSITGRGLISQGTSRIGRVLESETLA